MFAERMKELLALVLIGDGVLSFVDPERHSLLWQKGPAPWRRMMNWFVERPETTRWLGAGAVTLGLCLASRQQARDPWTRLSPTGR